MGPKTESDKTPVLSYEGNWKRYEKEGGYNLKNVAGWKYLFQFWSLFSSECYQLL